MKCVAFDKLLGIKVCEVNHIVVDECVTDTYYVALSDMFNSIKEIERLLFSHLRSMTVKFIDSIKTRYKNYRHACDLLYFTA